MAKYKLKNVKDGEDLVIPSLGLRVNNSNITDAVAERLIASGREKYVEEVKEVKSEKAEAKK